MNFTSTLPVLPVGRTRLFEQVVPAATVGKSSGLVPPVGKLASVIWTPEPLIKVMSDANVATPTICEPKLIGVGRAKTSATPVPVSGRIWGLPAASSLIKSEAERAPAAAGVKMTEIEQAPPGASEAGQNDVAAKSAALAPLSWTLLMCRGTPPVFVTVTPFEAG